jgi:predicted deacylase
MSLSTSGLIRGSALAKARVLSLFSSLSLFMVIVQFMVVPVLACAAPPGRPGAELIPGKAGIPTSMPTSSYAIPAWAEVTILAGPESGPVLMVIAGVHGDEVSGTMAARQLAAGSPPARGRLVFLSVAFPEALAAGQRWLPGWSDLNRAFPGTAGFGGQGSARSAYAVSDPTYQRADEILALIASVRPDLVLDLHESDQYWTEGDGPALVVPASTTSTGSVNSVSPESLASPESSVELALALLESPGMEGFSFTGPPPVGSLVAAVDGLLGIPALLVEAPDALVVDERIAVQLAVVRAAMRVLGMGTVPTSVP